MLNGPLVVQGFHPYFSHRNYEASEKARATQRAAQCDIGSCLISHIQAREHPGNFAMRVPEITCHVLPNIGEETLNSCRTNFWPKKMAQQQHEG